MPKIMAAGARIYLQRDIVMSSDNGITSRNASGVRSFRHVHSHVDYYGGTRRFSGLFKWIFNPRCPFAQRHSRSEQRLPVWVAASMFI